MSAIAGIIHTDGRPTNAASLAPMGEALAINGPDREERWSEGPTALLHRLLRITPEDAFSRQPLLSRDGRWAVVADARVDNRDELARALGIAPAEARLLADSQFILRAVERWGDASPEHLAGDFAYAAWDRRNRRLLLVRDPLGMRPLHWHLQGERLAFASLPKALLVLSGVPREIDEEYLAEHLIRVPRLGQATPFRGISRVLPGHYLIFERGNLHPHRYHRFDPEQRIRYRRDEEYVERARELLDQAVRCRLRAVGPIASDLSSGLDSTAVTATAARLLAARGEGLIAYTGVPREGFDGAMPYGRHADEGPGAAMVAARFPNIQHILIRSGKVSPLGGLDEHLARHLRLLRNPPTRAMGEAIYRDARRRGVRVELTGTLGNFTLSYAGLPRLASLLRQGRWGEWAREATALTSGGTVRWRNLLRLSVGPWIPSPLWSLILKIRGDALSLFSDSPIHPDFARRMRLAERAREMGWEVGPHFGADSWRQRVLAIQRNDRGENRVESEADFGIEHRDPTGDLRLLEFCLALPDEQFLSGGETRRLVRRMMAGILPEEILGARSRGLVVADWHEGLSDAREGMRERLELITALPEARRVLDVEELARILGRLPRNGGENPPPPAEMAKLLRGLACGTFLLNIYGRKP